MSTTLHIHKGFKPEEVMGRWKITESGFIENDPNDPNRDPNDPNVTDSKSGDWRDNPQKTPQDTPPPDRNREILDFCAEPKTRDEIQQFMGVSERKQFRNSFLKPLLESGQLLMTIPDKPTSKNQKYVRR